MYSVSKPDEPLPVPAPGAGLRLARIGPVLALALTGSVLLGTGLFIGALGLLGFPALAPVGQAGISLARVLDLLKLSFASTMRASIITCRTATSIFAISRRTSSSRVGTSWTKSVLVRASTTALPRLERMRCAGSESSFCTSAAFW